MTQNPHLNLAQRKSAEKAKLILMHNPFLFLPTHFVGGIMLHSALRKRFEAAFPAMDRLEQFSHLVIEATAKARKLGACVLDSDSRARVRTLMERANKTRRTAEVLAQASIGNGKGLDKATLNSALDRLIATMDGVNRELEELLAKAKGE